MSENKKINFKPEGKTKVREFDLKNGERVYHEVTITTTTRLFSAGSQKEEISSIWTSLGQKQDSFTWQDFEDLVAYQRKMGIDNWFKAGWMAVNLMSQRILKNCFNLENLDAGSQLEVYIYALDQALDVAVDKIPSWDMESGVHFDKFFEKNIFAVYRSVSDFYFGTDITKKAKTEEERVNRRNLSIDALTAGETADSEHSFFDSFSTDNSKLSEDFVPPEDQFLDAEYDSMNEAYQKELEESPTITKELMISFTFLQKFWGGKDHLTPEFLEAMVNVLLKDGDPEEIVEAVLEMD